MQARWVAISYSPVCQRVFSRTGSWQPPVKIQVDWEAANRSDVIHIDFHRRHASQLPCVNMALFQNLPPRREAGGSFSTHVHQIHDTFARTLGQVCTLFGKMQFAATIMSFFIHISFFPVPRGLGRLEKEHCNRAHGRAVGNTARATARSTKLKVSS